LSFSITSTITKRPPSERLPFIEPFTHKRGFIFLFAVHSSYRRLPQSAAFYIGCDRFSQPESLAALNPDSLYLLGGNMIDFRSHLTASHSAGVATSAVALAAYVGMTEMECDLMEIAGNLHDLGKHAIPNSILLKPAQLTADEFANIRQHTYFTYTVLHGRSVR
jgi:HD-GYP domain-containing protein (c-di-GMP phosphodiesterase class II)